MKSSASESIKNDSFNLERPSRSFCQAWPGIAALERLCNGFDSDAELSCAELDALIIITYFASSLTNCIRNGCGTANQIRRLNQQAYFC